MMPEKKWKRAVILVMAGFGWNTLIVLVKVFFPLMDNFALTYSNLTFVAFLGVYSLIDGFIIYLLRLLVRTNPAIRANVHLSVHMTAAGLAAAIFLRCFHIVYFLVGWSFWPLFFYDAALIAAVWLAFVPFAFFFYGYYRQMKATQETRLQTASLLACVGAIIVVLSSTLSLLAIFVPADFAWFFAVEYTVVVTIPRALAYLSILYFFKSLPQPQHPAPTAID